MNQITNFQLYKFYQRHIKNYDPEIVLICNHAMDLLTKKGLEKNVDEDSIIFFKNVIDIILDKYSNDYDNEKHRKLAFVTQTSKNYSKTIKSTNGKYTCYPFSVSEPSYYEIIINNCILNSFTLEETAEDLSNIINSNNKIKHDDFLKSDINFYYGDVHYILVRTLASIDAIKMLLQREDISNDEITFIITIYKQMMQIFNDMLSLTKVYDLNYLKENDYSNKEIIISKENYDSLVQLYKNVLTLENRLSPFCQQLWNKFNITNGGKIIHKLTNGIVESDQMDKICTFFVSNKAQYIPGYIGNTGYCYELNINNVLSLCETDVGSWRITKEEFIEREFPSRFQIDGSNIWYEYPYHSKLFPPEYIEKKAIEKKEFAEIVLDNTKQKNKPTMAFYTPDATEEEIAKITELALKQNIEVHQLIFNNQNNFNK